MRTIFVTWWAGFIGSNFLNKYVVSEKEVHFVNIDSLTYAGNLDNISVSTEKNYSFERVSICDKDSLRLLYKKYCPSDIIHFAAETHVDKSIKDPRIFTETNIIGTQNLLDLHREFRLNRFHFISTDEVYGDIPDGWFFTEDTPLNPSSPYSASKAWADMLVRAYGRTFGINYTITRCSNNYWPNQASEKLIPHFINLLCHWEQVTLYGDGSNIRDWLYVDDHCDAVWRVFSYAKNGSVFNIGWRNEYTNLEITRILLTALGKDESSILFVSDRPGHDKRYAIDASKIETELWFKPSIDFSEGIAKTINYYLKNRTWRV